MKKNKRPEKNQKLVTSPKEVVASAQYYGLNARLIEAFGRFYEYHPAKRFSRNLRSMVFEFLMYDGAAEAEYLRDLMIDLDGLFTMLDTMDDETKTG